MVQSLYDWATTEHDNPQVQRNRQFSAYQQAGAPGKFDDWLAAGGGRNISAKTPSFASGAEAVGGFVPGVGEAIDVKNAWQDVKAGDWTGAALNTGAALAGAVPLAGDIAALGLRGADAARATNILGDTGTKISRGLDQLGNTISGGSELGKAAFDAAVEHAPRGITGGAASTYNLTADEIDDEGWDDVPESSGPATQIDQASAANPIEEQQAPPSVYEQTAAASQKGLMAGTQTLGDLTDTGTPSAGTSLGGGQLDAGAIAALTVPNTFLSSGPASAGFAPQLAGLTGADSFGSAATVSDNPISDAYNRATDTTPNRTYESAHPLLKPFGFGGWKTEEEEDVMARNQEAANTVEQKTGVQVADEGTQLRSFQDWGTESHGDDYWNNVGETDTTGQGGPANANIATAKGDAEIDAILNDPSFGLDNDDDDGWDQPRTEHKVNAVGSMDAARGYSHGATPEPERESDNDSGGGGGK